jgi:hypothetical protein
MGKRYIACSYTSILDNVALGVSLCSIHDKHIPHGCFWTYKLDPKDLILFTHWKFIAPRFWELLNRKD